MTITTRKKLSHQGGTKHLGEKLGAVLATRPLQCIITIVTIIKFYVVKENQERQTERWGDRLEVKGLLLVNY